ncbi:unnamed protein product [Tetraodon nigroviridis]|uniref:Chromosome 10 SCAF15019, whole genome shotgun sequence n=1 Tax=Tetraodon nigroviridis TaxID=99883 RepID=Q4RM88_TETNG|nr:unnamed protein product [Tetraodon nigroviridis]
MIVSMEMCKKPAAATGQGAVLSPELLRKVSVGEEAPASPGGDPAGALILSAVAKGLLTLSAPSATRNKACAGLSGNPACEALMSEVIRRQQMNPVVGVAGAMMERRRRQELFFSGYPGRI